MTRPGLDGACVRDSSQRVRAQSEVIGVILLTAVVVILAVGVGGVVLGTFDTQDEPVANLQVEFQDGAVIVGHHGGTTLQKSDVTLVLQYTDIERYALTSFTELQGNSDEYFGPGERLSLDHGAWTSARVLLVHDPSNTVLYDRSFDIPEVSLPSLTWLSDADWDSAVGESNVVHDTFGDHSASQIELGYPSTETGLVGYWPLDGASGAATDASGTGNDGSVDGGPTREVGGILGTTAWEFDGVDDRITVPEDPTLEMNDTDAVTVSMWVNKSTNQSGWIALLQHSDTSYNLQFDNGNTPAFTVYDETWNTASSSEQVTPGRWYHLVATFDGGQARIYVNGSVTGTASADFIAPADGFPVGIAYNNDTGNRNLNGRLDAVRLYDRALTGAEVGSLWNTSSNGNLTTAPKQFEDPIDPAALSLEDVTATIPSATNVSVYVESDPEGDGTFNRSDEIRLDGSESYDVTGLGTESDTYRLRIELKTDDVTASPSFGGATLRVD